METKRYRLKIATWTVVREPGQPSLRKLDSPEAVVELARDLLHDYDDDKEHFWVILLNAQNHYLLAHMVSTGTQLSREVLGPALREGASALILIHNHPYRNKGVTGFPHPYLRAGEPTNGDYPTGEVGPPAHLYTDRIGVRSGRPNRHEPIDIRERMLRAKVRDDFTCQRCGAKARLRTHHRHGTKSHRLGTLVTLCETCHQANHGLEHAPCAPA